MGNKMIDLTGQKFGRLYVIEKSETKRGKSTGTFWKCRCDCGNITIVSGQALRNGTTISCGCYHMERLRSKERYIDITGEKFGTLTVLKKDKIDKNRSMCWLCKCDCGKMIVVSGTSLRSGNTKSCGCVGTEKLRKRVTTHGKYKTRLYRIWNNMKDRCYNEKCAEYYCYGGRGIKVCDEWLHDFIAFYNWSMDNGYRDDLTIDRKDVNGNYCPENCRWATLKDQLNNTSRNHRITYNGETHTMAEWAEITGINYKTICSRICDRKWDEIRAITTPPETKYAHK